MELVHIKGNSYYINNVNKIGLYVKDDIAYLIDSGNDIEAGKKILRILNENNLNLKVIISTHSNADHIGGNNYLIDKTGATVYSSLIENAFIKFPILETTMLYGGFPFNALRNKFLLAESSESRDIKELNSDLEVINLPGHFMGMIGIKTVDDVYFLADSLFGENIINKYHIFYIYDVDAFLKTLDYLESLTGYFVLSHAEYTDDIKPLVSLNRKKVFEIIDVIIGILDEPMVFEELLSKVMNYYSLKMDANQYVLVGGSLRSYVSYLINNDNIKYYFLDNKMYLVKN